MTARDQADADDDEADAEQLLRRNRFAEQYQAAKALIT